MKRFCITLQLVLLLGMSCFAQRVTFDSKYVKVGVMSNKWTNSLRENPNIRQLGDITSVPNSESGLNAEDIGKKVLDILFQRDATGLHMDRLYEQALQNTTVEEIEVALKDISAETKDILKREVAHQLLKNNYIVLFQSEKKKEKDREYWYVYHVGIDDQIIEQAYLNWRNPSTYDQITVPVKLVAKGKVRNYDNLVYDIAKKVPAFAVRGPVTSRFPFVSRMGSDMGVRNSGRIFLYRFKEYPDGNIYSKKVCTTRATEIGGDNTRMYMISGTFPSTKKGDVAVLRDYHRSSLSLMGQASFGDDARYGGRLQYEYLMNFSKSGVAQYLLAAVGYNRHDKEPAGIWWDETKTIQPTLNNANVSIGYGFGFNFLGRLEFMPYVMAGYQYSFITSGNDPMYYWDNNYQYPGDEQIGWWRDLYNRGLNSNHTEEDKGLYYHSFIAHGGARLSVNLWYPLQFMLGADYNFSTKKTSLDPILERHTLNRINIYAGLRLHF